MAIAMLALSCGAWGLSFPLTKAVSLAEDPFTSVGDDQSVPPGDVIISLTRFQAEGEGLLSEGRSVGVRLSVKKITRAPSGAGQTGRGAPETCASTCWFIRDRLPSRRYAARDRGKRLARYDPR